MNPNDCQSCLWKGKPDGGFCYWWHTEPNVNCNWFEYRGVHKAEKKRREAL